jgi:hypothetical protein
MRVPTQNFQYRLACAGDLVRFAAQTVGQRGQIRPPNFVLVMMGLFHLDNSLAGRSARNFPKVREIRKSTMQVITMAEPHGTFN